MRVHMKLAGTGDRAVSNGGTGVVVGLTAIDLAVRNAVRGNASSVAEDSGGLVIDAQERVIVCAADVPSFRRKKLIAHGLAAFSRRSEYELR